MDRIIAKKKWYQRKSTWITAGGIVVLILAYVLVLGDTTSKLNVNVERITISEVSRGEFLEFIPATGTVQPIRTIYLDAVEGGRVEAIFVEDGHHIAEGDSILRLANTDLVLDIMFREAQLYEQSNNLRNTRISMEQRSLDLRRQLLELNLQISQQEREKDRAEALHVNSLISTQEYGNIMDRYEYLVNLRNITFQNARQDSIFRAVQIERLEASVDRMQSNLDIVRENQENLTVRAPISGQLSALNAEIGQTKTPGQRLGQIDVLDTFRVQAAIDEYYISRVEEGKRAEFTFAGDEYRMEITKIYPEVRDGRFDVDLEFVGDVPEGIRRGQTVRLRLELSDPEEAILLARGGFYNSTGGHWVFLVDPSGGFAYRHDIRLGRQNPQMYEVLEGLEPGMQVVTSSYETFGNAERLILRD